MGFLSILGQTHKLIQDRVKPGDIVIDATVGNGNDTLFLRKLVGDNGIVCGFDVQSTAIENTLKRLSEANLSLEHVHLINNSHDKMLEVLPPSMHEKVSAITFNLGYLPGGDHSIITQQDSTIRALQHSLLFLEKDGIITIVVYSGHPGGEEEADAVLTWVQNLPQQYYQVLSYQFLNQKNNPPYLIAILKR
ncbi:class I SAM-dependent methyltransferase [Chengkuizengella axinellae]|uniref:Class I SAM-dependent methyltransferase n=1 Tax=Chengkuizengella axinellae TaxID=3064388 RepID=A0ABT9J3Q5_9BACL|nr:class I SAM-dependent methyltransferase [Chengkuizengella sp. 2205SS18-9]MDP5276251.1 class I SAM-dependent methyltransferase [Chengkuizengella sp. 2205SS18-9]